MAQSDRPTYTSEQVQEYLDYVGKNDHITKEMCDTEAGLSFLNELLLLHQSRVPFENLGLHYSSDHTMSIDTEYLFQNIVSRKAGRGGYCLQNNLFFATILRALGYKVMPCGARVSSAAAGVRDPAKVSYSGWSHVVNIVHIAGRKYFIDTGFGATTPGIAVPLVDGWTGSYAWNNEVDIIRLDKTHILGNTFQQDEQKLWVYSARIDQQNPWLPLYCFSELEFLPQDYHVMNFYVSRSLHSFFTHAVMARKVILDQQGNEVGELTMFNSVFKLKKYGKSEVLLEAKSEEERIQGLEKYFDIKLNSMETRGIAGYVSMLKG